VPRLVPRLEYERHRQREHQRTQKRAAKRPTEGGGHSTWWWRTCTIDGEAGAQGKGQEDEAHGTTEEEEEAVAVVQRVYQAVQGSGLLSWCIWSSHDVQVLLLALVQGWLP
jgi:hypothetical protein